MNETEAFQDQMNEEAKKTDVAFLQNRVDNESDSVLNKHLDATEMLEQIEKLLMGYEYDTDSDEWKKVMITLLDEEGKPYSAEQGPILEPSYVRMTVGYLKTFLNSNVYLSYIENMDQINEIMWDVKKKLTILLHPLKKTHDSRQVDVINSMIENPIYFALTRGYRKNTLDALSKMQHSIEHLNTSPSQANQQQEKKQFKVFGF